MGEGSYRRWAEVVWRGKPFHYTTAVPGKQAVISRFRSCDVNVKTIVREGQWQEHPYKTVADDLMPPISWLAIEVDQPMLVEIRQNGSPVIRLLVITKPAAADDAGQVPRPTSQENYMMVERIKVLIKCDAWQARELKSAVKDAVALQIFGFAAYLLKQCGPSVQDAQDALRRLWRFTPDQICSAIPPRFHVVATTDRPDKIYMDLERCINLMARRGLHE